MLVQKGMNACGYWHPSEGFHQKRMSPKHGVPRTKRFQINLSERWEVCCQKVPTFSRSSAFCARARREKSHLGNYTPMENNCSLNALSTEHLASSADSVQKGFARKKWDLHKNKKSKAFLFKHEKILSTTKQKH